MKSPEDLVERIGASSGAIENRLASDMRRFKDFIESRGVESGAWRGDVGPMGGAATVGASVGADELDGTGFMDDDEEPGLIDPTPYGDGGVDRGGRSGLV